MASLADQFEQVRLLYVTLSSETNKITVEAAAKKFGALKARLRTVVLQSETSKKLKKQFKDFQELFKLRSYEASAISQELATTINRIIALVNECIDANHKGPSKEPVVKDQSTRKQKAAMKREQGPKSDEKTQMLIASTFKASKSNACVPSSKEKAPAKRKVYALDPGNCDVEDNDESHKSQGDSRTKSTDDSHEPVYPPSSPQPAPAPPRPTSASLPRPAPLIARQTAQVSAVSAAAAQPRAASNAWSGGLLSLLGGDGASSYGASESVSRVFRVAGTTFYPVPWAQMRQLPEVRLVYEDYNPHDLGNAIRVDTLNGRTIGHIERQRCREIRDLCPWAPPAHCRVHRVTGGGYETPNFGLLLSVQLPARAQSGGGGGGSGFYAGASRFGSSGGGRWASSLGGSGSGRGMDDEWDDDSDDDLTPMDDEYPGRGSLGAFLLRQQRRGY